MSCQLQALRELFIDVVAARPRTSSKGKMNRLSLPACTSLDCSSSKEHLRTE